MPRADEAAKRIPIDAALWSRAFPHLESLFARIGDRGRWDPFVVIRLKRWSMGRVAIIGDAAHAMAPNLGQGGGCGMMNGLSLAVYLDRHDDVAAALADWERIERPLTEHTQRLSTLYGKPATWPPRLRAWVYDLAHKSAWLNRQRLRTASHTPTGWPG